MSISDYYYDEINSEENLQELDNQEPIPQEDDKKTSERKSKPTYCWKCGGLTGFGFGVEPLRHDIAWCSSECHHKFYNTK